MKKHYNIVIAGAGGIAQAAGLLLAEWSEVTPTLYIGNRTLEKAQKAAEWIASGATKPCAVSAFHLTCDALSDEMRAILKDADILLDCLPGSMAPKLARLAKAFHLHYANMTEYVAETNQIMALAHDAETGFVLQSGIAPGYIDVLAHGMYQQFCRDFGVEKVDKIEMKVGALTAHAVAPHYYGFTWSPIGVATEYVKDAVVIREFKKTHLHSLSERGTIIINGITYEDDLTSGGAADLPDFLEGKVRSLDYKTLRYPGHYAWVKEQLVAARHQPDPFAAFEALLNRAIPHVEDDRIVLYAAVQGKDAGGTLQRREVGKLILPQLVGKHTLRAIQTTTAVPMLQAAQMLLESPRKGVILQSQIDPVPFLNGNFVTPVYGTA